MNPQICCITETILSNAHWPLSLSLIQGEREQMEYSIIILIMKERSERALRQVKYLKADHFYNLLSCLAVLLFLLFGGLVRFFFLPAGDKRGTLEMRLHKAETVLSLQTLCSTAHV